MSEQPIHVYKPNEVYLQLQNINQSQKMELGEFFSRKVKNYFFNPLYKAKKWDGTVRFFNLMNHTLPIGLLPMFKEFCKRYQYSYEYKFDYNEELEIEISNEDINNFCNTLFSNTDIKLRDYQEESISKAIRHKRGVIELCTSGGKSAIIYSIIRFILAAYEESKILLIVPNINLVNQMFSDFQDYGWESHGKYISTIYSKSHNIDWDKPVIISTWQSIYKKSESFFERFNAVLVDETHGSAAKSVQSCLKKCISAEFRIGLTGTLPNDSCDLLNIFGYLGPKLFTLKSSELIKKGFLSNIKIANVVLKYPEQEIYNFWHSEDGIISKDNYNQELKFVFNHSKRNRIFKYIIKKINKEDNILILCGLVDHLKSIKEYLQKEFPDRDVLEIYGQTDVEVREETRKLANIEGGKIIVASFGTMSVGVNINRLHHIFLASSYKSKIRVLQSIGRGLRKHESKEKLIVWDIIDNLTWVYKRKNKLVKHLNSFYSHWLQRLQFYKNQEFNFVTKTINIDELDK